PIARAGDARTDFGARAVHTAIAERDEYVHLARRMTRRQLVPGNDGCAARVGIPDVLPIDRERGDGIAFRLEKPRHDSRERAGPEEHDRLHPAHFMNVGAAGPALKTRSR